MVPMLLFCKNLAPRLFVLFALFVLFFFFCFASVFPFSADKQLYWLLTETTMELPSTLPSWSSSDPDVPQMGAGAEEPLPRDCAQRGRSQLQSLLLESVAKCSTWRVWHCFSLLITLIWGCCKYHTYVLPLFVFSLSILFAGITKSLQCTQKSQANVDNSISSLDIRQFLMILHSLSYKEMRKIDLCWSYTHLLCGKAKRRINF